jgi:hypothetical protein
MALKDEEYLPKMLISFQPQIESCTNEDFEKVCFISQTMAM